MKFSLTSVPSAGTSSRTNYPDILNQGWKAHLTERTVKAPTVISTFAGAGGSSLGYSMAGYREKLAVEIDGHAVATFKANFKDVPVYSGDIADLSVKEALKLSDLKPGQLSVLDGSPPCQGFSLSGKRLLDDPRNQLFQEFVRLLRGLQPLVFVMENVSGLVKGKMRLIFADILRELKASGYRVTAWLMDAMYFSVPQSRQRLIFIGVRNNLGIEPSHPKALARPIPAGAALLGCARETVPPLSATYAPYWPLINVGGSLADYMEKVRGKRSHFSDIVKLDPRKPSRTLMKTATPHGFATMVHWNEARAITIAEAKRLASFPDSFQIAGSYKDCWARIGNSVPPFFMRAIALHVRQELLQCG